MEANTQDTLTKDTTESAELSSNTSAIATPKHAYRVKQLGNKYIVVTLGNTRLPGFHSSRRHALSAIEAILRQEGGIRELSEAAKLTTEVTVAPKPIGGTVAYNLEPEVAPIALKVAASVKAKAKPASPAFTSVNAPAASKAAKATAVASKAIKPLEDKVS